MHNHFSCQVCTRILYDSLHTRKECSEAVKKIRNKNPTDLDKNVHNIFLMALLVMSHSQMWSYRMEAKIKSKTKLYTGNQLKTVAMQVSYWATRNKTFPSVMRHHAYLEPLGWKRFWKNVETRTKKRTLFRINGSSPFLKTNQPHSPALWS